MFLIPRRPGADLRPDLGRAAVCIHPKRFAGSSFWLMVFCPPLCVRAWLLHLQSEWQSRSGQRLENPNGPFPLCASYPGRVSVWRPSLLLPSTAAFRPIPAAAPKRVGQPVLPRFPSQALQEMAASDLHPPNLCYGRTVVGLVCLLAAASNWFERWVCGWLQHPAAACSRWQAHVRLSFQHLRRGCRPTLPPHGFLFGLVLNGRLWASSPVRRQPALSEGTSNHFDSGPPFASCSPAACWLPAPAPSSSPLGPARFRPGLWRPATDCNALAWPPSG